MLAYSLLILGFSCSEVSSIEQSRRFDCVAEGKTFHVLELRGRFSEVAYAHARLLAEEVQRGPLREISESLQRDTAEGSLAARELKKAIVACYGDRIQNSISSEMLHATRRFASGLEDALGRKNPWSQKEILDLSTAIELSIAGEGLMRRLEVDPVGVGLELASVCGITLSLREVESLILELHQLGRLKLGCLGFVSPSSENSGGSLMHGRNFDADLVLSWNNAPTLFLVEEPGFLKYAAAASAGVFYPGGISGFNEAGIAVSLHEMSTTKYQTFHSGRRAELAPFLQQRILREARSIDEAVRLVRSVKHFGAWTILISDSKTDEAASIEISGERVQVARRVRDESLGQANHFIGNEMRDQFFTYSFGKTLESLSRLQVVERSLEEASALRDIRWGIDQLSSHEDAFEGRRAFGRTAVKAYNVMSTLVLPARSEFWISLGDRRPAAHSHFLGFEIDFSSLSFRPLDLVRTSQFEDVPNWEDSLADYVAARSGYELGLKEHSLRRVQRAHDLALKDGVDETTYLYVEARILLELKRESEAHQVLLKLWKRRGELHSHKQALVALYLAYTTQRLKLKNYRAERIAYAKFASGIFERLYRATKHFDAKSKWKMAEKIRSGQMPEIPEIDFVTVE